MPKTKIQDEAEVRRWFAEGRTLSWMREQYDTKYHIETSPAMWAEFRRRKGIDRRITRDLNLLPWSVRREHRWSYLVAMLRLVARQREGMELTDVAETRVYNFLRHLDENGLVVAYDPESEEGFSLVHRHENDDDIIRRPLSGLSQRGNRDEE